MSGKDMSYGGNPLYNGHKQQPEERGTSGCADTSSGTVFPAGRVMPPARLMPEGYTIAVDFDGTLCENRFPDIGEPKPLVIEYIKRQAAMGARIILHTCRENGYHRALLDEAVAFCVSREITLYAVNENPDNPYREQYGTGPGRKVYADLS